MQFVCKVYLICVQLSQKLQEGCLCCFHEEEEEREKKREGQRWNIEEITIKLIDKNQLAEIFHFISEQNKKKPPNNIIIHHILNL